jgi:serralysin
MSTPTELEAYFLKLVNAERAKAGVTALTIDSELVASAHSHSAWMDSVDTLSHTGVGGSSPGDRIEDAGYDARGWGENVGYVSGSACAVMDKAEVEQLHQNLMNSSGHRANLLSANFKEIGIGLEHGDMNGRPAVFVTQNFGTPTAAEAAENDGVTPLPGPTPEPQPIPLPHPEPIPLPLPQPEPTPGLALMGSWKSETIGGTRGDDRIDAKGGHDRLYGGLGDDSLTGGSGRDDFVFTGKLWGDDKVTDFQRGDDLVFSKSVAGTVQNVLDHAHTDNGNTVIDFGTDQTVTLLGVDAHVLTHATVNLA